MYYTGKEVCQGCKKPGTQSERMNKDELCKSCKSYLELGTSKEVELSKNYIYVSQFYHALSSVEFGDRCLNTCLLDVLESLNNKNAQYKESLLGLVGEQGGSASLVVRMPQEFIKPIQILFTKLDGYVKKLRKDIDNLPITAKSEVAKEKNSIYNEGIEEGKKLLIGLNNGTVSLHDFEQEQNKFWH